MDEIGKVSLKTITLFGKAISFNPNVFIMTWVVIGLLLLLGYLATRKISIVPGKLQNIFELLIEFLKEIVYSTLGEKEGKKHLPMIATLFIFILISNWIGLVPNFFAFFGAIIALIAKLLGSDSVKIVYEGITNISVIPDPSAWYAFLYKLPHIEEPTKFLSTDLAMALIVFLTVHVYSIKNKGLLKYFSSYMEPLPEKAPYIYFFWLNPFFYLNIVGQLANTVSHSFRLFGNIFGGGIIIIIVSELLRYFLIPVGLFAFFGIFAGTIQAFVFTMLAVSYIAQMQ